MEVCFIWFSFSIGWFLGSMWIFSGVAILGMQFQVALRKGVFRCVCVCDAKWWESYWILSMDNQWSWFRNSVLLVTWGPSNFVPTKICFHFANPKRLGKELPVGDYMEYGTMALGREYWVPCMAHLRLVFLCFNGRPLWVHLYLYDLLCSAEYDESKKKWQGEQGNTSSVVVCCRAWCCVHVCVGSKNFPDQILLQFWPAISRRSKYFFLLCELVYQSVFVGSIKIISGMMGCAGEARVLCGCDWLSISCRCIWCRQSSLILAIL